jgi:cytoskeletal protein RodZ
MEATSIGELLRETRLRRGLDLVAVAEQTRISPRNLQAIEDGNFTSLPAEVFTRGFYTLYAKMLSLDPDEVLEMYGQERRKFPNPDGCKTPPPHRLAQEMANLAERPTSLPFSYFGLILFLFLFFGAFLCWYFRWNPASFLSEKLRSLEAPPQSEQVMNGEVKPAGRQLIFETAMAEAAYVKPAETLSLFSPSTVTAATGPPEILPKSPVELPKAEEERTRLSKPDNLLR